MSTGEAVRGPAERGLLGAVAVATAERGGLRQRFAPARTPFSLDRDPKAAAIAHCQGEPAPMTASQSPARGSASPRCHPPPLANAMTPARWTPWQCCKPAARRPWVEAAGRAEA